VLRFRDRPYFFPANEVAGCARNDPRTLPDAAAAATEGGEDDAAEPPAMLLLPPPPLVPRAAGEGERSAAKEPVAGGDARPLGTVRDVGDRAA